MLNSLCLSVSYNHLPLPSKPYCWLYLLNVESNTRHLAIIRATRVARGSKVSRILTDRQTRSGANKRRFRAKPLADHAFYLLCGVSETIFYDFHVCPRTPKTPYLKIHGAKPLLYSCVQLRYLRRIAEDVNERHLLCLISSNVTFVFDNIVKK